MVIGARPVETELAPIRPRAWRGDVKYFAKSFSWTAPKHGAYGR